MTQPQRWLDTLDPHDLTITVPGGLVVRVMPPVTWQELDRPVACPWCRSAYRRP